MRSKGWSLTLHKYWQRRDNLDSMKHIRKPKSEENCMCVSTHIHRCTKKRIKRFLKISFSNKSYLLQQIYSGKYGNFESRFLTFHHLPAGKTNPFGKYTSCSVNLCWNMQSWERAGGFTAGKEILPCHSHCHSNITVSAVTQTRVLLALNTFVQVSVTGSLFPVQAWWEGCCSKHYALTFVHP